MEGICASGGRRTWPLALKLGAWGVLGLYWENGKENGTYYNGYIGYILGDNGFEAQGAGFVFRMWDSKML